MLGMTHEMNVGMSDHINESWTFTIISLQQRTRDALNFAGLPQVSGGVA